MELTIDGSTNISIYMEQMEYMEYWTYAQRRGIIEKNGTIIFEKASNTKYS